MAPRHLAAIDVGSNAMRLRVVQVTPGGRHVELASVRAPVRLGADVFATGKIARATLARAADWFVELRELMDDLGVHAYRAVATSATRDADNRSALVQAAKKAHLELEIIDGEEEARLVRSSLRRTIDLDGRTVTADIGGGSTEVTIFHDERVVRSTSLPLGTLRLGHHTAAYRSGPSGVIGARHHRALDESISRALAKVSPSMSGADQFVATGGTARALAKICSRGGGATNEISLADVTRLTQRLRVMTDTERMRTFGLRADRADTIVPGALVLTRLAVAAGAPTILVPAAGVRDGILADLDLRLRSSAA